jgi:hypothetical protein
MFARRGARLNFTRQLDCFMPSPAPGKLNAKLNAKRKGQRRRFRRQKSIPC